MYIKKAFIFVHHMTHHMMLCSQHQINHSDKSQEVNPVLNNKYKAKKKKKKKKKKELVLYNKRLFACKIKIKSCSRFLQWKINNLVLESYTKSKDH